MTQAEFEPVIGLEVHVQLATASKLFCGCPAASFGAPPNSHVCPVCTGQPGALPVLNKKAIELAFTAAIAVDADIKTESVFSRKNYFYPDLPKGYQISQFDEPFCRGGHIDVIVPTSVKRIRIHRIHLEEDAGKLIHDIGSEILPYSLVDLNRSSVPLCEIVSEPDMVSSEEAYQYLTELKAILQYLGVSHCDMEKGEMRCDANVSIKPKGVKELGTKVEIKNLNSFKAVRDAIDFEIGRQSDVLIQGGRISQETRLWDDGARETRPMRSKEEAHDYRYFPEPDLVPLAADPALVDKLREGLPELPRARRARFAEKLGLPDYDARVLTASRSLADYFEEALAASKGRVKPKTVANWVGTEFLSKLNASGGWSGGRVMPASRLAELLGLVEDGTLSGKLAKDVFAQAWETNESPAELVKKQGLSQVSDEGQLRAWAEEAVRESPKAVQDFQSGNERAIGALVGAVMKKSKGKANPGKINEVLKELLKQVSGGKA